MSASISAPSRTMTFQLAFQQGDYASGYHTMNAIKSQTMIFSKFALKLALMLENVHLMDKLRVGSIDPIPE